MVLFQVSVLLPFSQPGSFGPSFFFFFFFYITTFWLSGKESTCNVRHLVLIPGLQIPWRRKWQTPPVFLPGEIPWTEEPGGLQSTGSQRVGHKWNDSACTEKEMVTHSSTLAREISWTEEPGFATLAGSERVKHNLATEWMNENVWMYSLNWLLPKDI